MHKIIIITWWSGFIWSAFLQNYLKTYSKYTFINIDIADDSINIPEDMRNLQNYHYYKTDITDYKQLEKIYTKHNPTDTIHFAAETNVWKSLEYPEIFIKTNVIGTQNLLDLHVSFWCNKFIYISTDEVYGSAEDDKSFSEQDIYNPTNPYSVSKVSAELLVKTYWNLYDINYNITRTTNNYGPGQSLLNLVPLCITNSLKQKSIPLHWKWNHLRDWIYVDDNCEAILKIFLDWAKKEIYNISWENILSSKEVAIYILDLLSKNSQNNITYIPDRLWNDEKYLISSKKIKKELWYKNRTPFNKWMLNTIEYYKRKI